MTSLQEQLLKAGMVDKNKAGKIKKEKHKRAKQQSNGQVLNDENKVQAQRARAEKKVRDKLTNMQRQIEADKKAIAAQIIQLVTLNRIDRKKGDIPYQFTDNKKIKKIYVTDQLQDQLGRGLIAIAQLGEGYEIVPAVVADKIKQRDERVIVQHNSKAVDDITEDDPYAEFQVPDDLMW